jgi:photosystem II stability/assembly factor-like uncharacterized protein
MRVVFFLVFLLWNIQMKGQWTKTNGPEGMSINAFYTYNNILFAATNAKGVYKSFDNGLNWVASNTPQTSNLDLLCIHSDDSYIFVGGLGTGVLRSADNGITWEIVNTGMGTQTVNCLLAAGGYLFAGTIGSGIYRSADHGSTWISVNQNLLTSSFIHSMVCQNNRLIIEADNYLFFTLDYGLTWDVDQGITSFYVIKNFFHHGDTLLASSYNTLFRSTDGGVNWDGPFYMGNNLIGFDNVGDTIYAGYKYGVYRSTDWGVNWTIIPSSGLRWGERGENDFIISGNRMLIGIDHIGVYSSDDKGLTWTQCDLFDFERASTADDALIYHNGTVYTGTHSDGIYKTTNQGATWTKIGTPDNQDTLSNSIIFSMLHLDPDIILAGACGKGLYRSTDGGATWTHITAGLPTEGPNNFTCVKTLAKSGSNILAALTKGVYLSTDLGLTWQPTSITGDNILQSGGFAVRNNIVCVGVIGHPSINYTGIYRSIDYGNTWVRVIDLLDIEFMGAGGNSTMYAGSLFSGYVSHNDGLSWSGIPVNGVFAIHAWDNYALIGNPDGVVFSADNGNTWTLKNEGMDPYPNKAVEGFTRDNLNVYAAPYHSAIWKRPLASLIFGALPVKLNDFTVVYQNGVSTLRWKTFTESNTSHFEVQRGFTGNDFTQIGNVPASGNSSSMRQYMFEDRSPQPGVNFYRIEMFDQDGKSSFSSILSIKVGNNDNFITVFPNPVTDKTITVQLNNMAKGLYKIELFNSVGQSVYANSVNHPGGSLMQAFQLPGTMPEGIYTLHIITNERTYRQKLIVR